MAIALCLTLCLIAALAGCGRSDRQRESERVANEAAEQAVADSLAEEREKDRQMRAAAAAEANEEVARAVGGTEENPTPRAAARPAAERQASDGGDPLGAYVERLQQSVSDPATLQVRNAAPAPQRNAMCAEFSARDKSGIYAGFKRVIVTDVAVVPEEPPLRETLARFLAFQTAARETGCFPDVLDVHALR